MVTALLPLAIAFGLLRMVLAILFPVAGVRPAPLLGTVQRDLPIHRIGSDFLTLIIAAASPLTRGLAANDLLRMITGRLKNLLTVRATAITHQAAPAQECDGVILFGSTREIESPTRKSLHIETPIEFFTASPPMGPLLIKPVGLMLFYAGAD
ncbi:MAG: hypothetical protein WB579_22305, partial [Bryobacteraceae bacterium]